MIRSEKFRLYPNKEDEAKLNHTLFVCRITYNKLLEEMGKQEKPNKFELSRMIPGWKKEDPIFASVHSSALIAERDKLFWNLTALGRLKKNGRRVGRLRFKNRFQFKTFTYQKGFKIIERDSSLQLLHLSKIGGIPILLHRDIGGVVKQVTVKQIPSGEWFAYLRIDDGVDAPEKRPIEKAVGIDVGLTSFLVDSDERVVSNPKYLKKSLKKLRLEQRRLSRKKKGSKNRKKQILRVAKVYERVCNQRDDFLHKLSHEYVDAYDMVATEKLDIAGMRDKRWLNMGISDASWDKFNMMLSYKAERAGKTHVMVDPKDTTQLCSRCGERVPKTLRERSHSCPKCGLVCSRDFNASLNILSRGLAKVGQVLPELKPVETLPLSHLYGGESKVVESGTTNVCE